jgi:uracil-DNA glycosylase
MNTEQPPGNGHPAAFLPTLDARQRAMLAEMGVRVWAPRATPGPADAPAAASQPAQAPTAAAAPARPATAAVPVRVAPAAPEPPAPVTVAPATATASPPPLAGVDTMDWASLRAAVAGCQACSLSEGRTRSVFGTGPEQADWMVVGEAPGEQEDREGEPYQGEAGRLLDNMLRAVGRSRSAEGPQAAYVSHVLKCRPPPSRNPQPAEVALCTQYLARQVTLLQPKVILALGPLAAQALLQNQAPIGKLRGQVHRFQGIPVVVTFPPSHLLRTPANKAKAWADLCLALAQLPPPAHSPD